MSTIEKLISKVETDNGGSVSHEQQPASVRPDVVSSLTQTASQPANKVVSERHAAAAHEPAYEFGTERIIPLDGKRMSASGIVMPDEMDARIRDEYRRIKRPLLANAFGKTAELVDHGNLLLVTSSLPDEGKTFTAINLALSITTERDNTVLLVDADVAKSDVTRILGYQNQPGLTDYLIDESLDINEIIIRTDVPNLRVIPSGKRHAHLTELIGSNRMKELVLELSGRYPDRMVIFDAPPMLATSEAQLLADMCGQVSLVIKAGKTPQRAVQDAIALLDRNKAIGVVLNQLQHLFGSNFHSGYYGYYHYGEKEE